jgi:hypothetical protein
MASLKEHMYKRAAMQNGPGPKPAAKPAAPKKEEVKGLTLKRANELERRTPEKIKGDSRTKYEREILPVTQIKRGSKLGGFQQDSVMNKAWERQAAGYQAADAKQDKMDKPYFQAADLEENLPNKYKIPTKTKKKKR